MRNMKTQLKDSLEGFNKRLEQTEEIISKLEYRSIEVIQVEEQKEKRMEKN